MPKHVDSLQLKPWVEQAQAFSIQRSAVSRQLILFKRIALRAPCANSSLEEASTLELSSHKHLN
ncbi:MAG: hypothetical protein F6J94_14580 [Moorea sp. SIO1F2]|uniref:hypothetical protein n=1 Tax=Moorena sp. SIO1F2 TaxID=2607819 RepID=UPI0013BE1289|nr:hypothetical protein [Moorena sp. SIO1F2]NET83102.1 hypothetical protein [Moorena sp. SIO1F2]